MPNGHTLLLVHGGGFIGGWRDMPAVRTVARSALAAGLTVVCPDYRVLFRGGRFAEAVADIHAAWDWLDDHDSLTGPTHLMGISAGAALAAAVAADRDPTSLVLIYGPHDFSLLPGWAARALTRNRDPRAIATASPARRCTTEAPTLLVHGRRDRLCPIAHSEALLNTREQRGLSTRFEVLPEAGHGFLNWSDRPDTRQVCGLVEDWLRDLSE